MGVHHGRSHPPPVPPRPLHLTCSHRRIHTHTNTHCSRAYPETTARTKGLHGQARGVHHDQSHPPTVPDHDPHPARSHRRSHLRSPPVPHVFTHTPRLLKDHKGGSGICAAACTTCPQASLAPPTANIHVYALAEALTSCRAPATSPAATQLPCGQPRGAAPAQPWLLPQPSRAHSPHAPHLPSAPPTWAAPLTAESLRQQLLGKRLNRDELQHVHTTVNLREVALIFDTSPGCKGAYGGLDGQPRHAHTHTCVGIYMHPCEQCQHVCTPAACTCLGVCGTGLTLAANKTIDSIIKATVPDLPFIEHRVDTIKAWARPTPFIVLLVQPEQMTGLLGAQAARPVNIAYLRHSEGDRPPVKLENVRIIITTPDRVPNLDMFKAIWVDKSLRLGERPGILATIYITDTRRVRISEPVFAEVAMTEVLCDVLSVLERIAQAHNNRLITMRQIPGQPTRARGPDPAQPGRGMCIRVWLVASVDPTNPQSYDGLMLPSKVAFPLTVDIERVGEEARPQATWLVPDEPSPPEALRSRRLPDMVQVRWAVPELVGGQVTDPKDGLTYFRVGGATEEYAKPKVVKDPTAKRQEERNKARKLAAACDPGRYAMLQEKYETIYGTDGTCRHANQRLSMPVGEGGVPADDIASHVNSAPPTAEVVASACINARCQRLQCKTTLQMAAAQRASIRGAMMTRAAHIPGVAQPQGGSTRQPNTGNAETMLYDSNHANGGKPRKGGKATVAITSSPRMNSDRRTELSPKPPAGVQQTLAAPHAATPQTTNTTTATGLLARAPRLDVTAAALQAASSLAAPPSAKAAKPHASASPSALHMSRVTLAPGNQTQPAVSGHKLHRCVHMHGGAQACTHTYTSTWVYPTTATGAHCSGHGDAATARAGHGGGLGCAGRDCPSGCRETRGPPCRRACQARELDQVNPGWPGAHGLRQGVRAGNGHGIGAWPTYRQRRGRRDHRRAPGQRPDHVPHCHGWRRVALVRPPAGRVNGIVQEDGKEHANGALGEP